MTDPEAIAERDIQRAVKASRRADGCLWVSAFYAARIVGTYARYGAQAIADAADKEVSTVQNWAHAYWMLEMLRNVRSRSEVRRIRQLLTITHFWTLYDMVKKYSFTELRAAQYLEQMILNKAQRQPASADALEREIEAAEERGGSVPTWKYYQPRIRSLLADVMALGRDGVSPAVWTWVMSAPEEVKR